MNCATLLAAALSMTPPSAAAPASAPASRPAETIIVLDRCVYPTAEAARAAWVPAQRQTPPMDVAAGGGIELNCDFKANREWRVAWDLSGRWDLSGASEIALDVSAGARGASLIVHMRSGNGWLGRTFQVPAGDSTAVLTRKQFKPEGTPAGWRRIDGVRLSVMRRGEDDRRVRVRNLRAVVRPGLIAIYRNDAGNRAEPGLASCTRRVADALDRLGLDYEIVGDQSVAAGGLTGKRVAILPLNPVLPAPAAAAVREFVAAGGKLLVCYGLPAPLPELLGVRHAGAVEGRKSGKLAAIEFQGRGDRPKIRTTQDSWIAHVVKPRPGTKVVGRWVDDKGKLTDVAAVTRNANGYFVGHVLTRADPPGKDRLLMEMIGELWRGAWRVVYERGLSALGRAAGLGGVADLSAAAVANAAGDAPRLRAVKAALAKADAFARDARGAMAYGDPIVAAELIARARDAYVRAYAASVASPSGEFRAVWCHAATGVAGMTWDQAAKALADAGFNAVIPNMLWGDAAAYPSKILPVMPVVAEKGDQLAACVAAARKHGLGVHVWKVNWRFWGRAPGNFRERMAAASRVQIDPKGKPLNWLCPSSEANQALERDSMLEVVRNYPVAGVHFDYIRYPGRQGCYCPRCRAKFEKRFGVKADKWPGDVLDTGPLAEKYLQFRRDQITPVVAAVAAEARKIRPGVLISAAVFWHWPSARNNIGQDWKLWVDKGYLDFVCPMQYTTSPALLADWTKQTRAWTAGKCPLMTGLGATLGQGPDVTLQQILLARRGGADGFVLFNYNPHLAKDYLPLLHLGATARPTTWRPPR